MKSRYLSLLRRLIKGSDYLRQPFKVAFSFYEEGFI